MPTTLLVEDLLLAASHPARGTIRRPHGLALPRAVAGAAIIDLLSSGSASLERGSLLVAATPDGPHRALDEVAAALAGGGLPVDHAIDVLAAPRTRLGQHVLLCLSADGAVVRRRRRVLGAVPVTSYRAGGGTAAALRARVTAALAGPVDDPRAAALARLVIAGQLHRHLHLPVHAGAPACSGAADDGQDAHDHVMAAVDRTIRRARRSAATADAAAAVGGAVAASGS